jgi:hypothetical protein
MAVASNIRPVVVAVEIIEIIEIIEVVEIGAVGARRIPFIRLDACSG